jgi:hypothetical protein
MTPGHKIAVALRAILAAKGPRETARNPHEVGAGITNADAPRLPPTPDSEPFLAADAFQIARHRPRERRQRGIA